MECAPCFRVANNAYSKQRPNKWIDPAVKQLLTESQLDPYVEFAQSRGSNNFCFNETVAEWQFVWIQEATDFGHQHEFMHVNNFRMTPWPFHKSAQLSRAQNPLTFCSIPSRWFIPTNKTWLDRFAITFNLQCLGVCLKGTPAPPPHPQKKHTYSTYTYNSCGCFLKPSKKGSLPKIGRRFMQTLRSTDLDSRFDAVLQWQCVGLGAPAGKHHLTWLWVKTVLGSHFGGLVHHPF